MLRMKKDKQVDMGKTSLLELNGVNMSYHSAKEAIINELEECFLLLLKDLCVTNFIRPYLHQFFDDSHGLNGCGKPLKRPFDRYQSRLEAISIGQDIRQINW